GTSPALFADSSCDAFRERPPRRRDLRPSDEAESPPSREPAPPSRDEPSLPRDEPSFSRDEPSLSRDWLSTEVADDSVRAASPLSAESSSDFLSVAFAIAATADRDWLCFSSSTGVLCCFEDSPAWLPESPPLRPRRPPR